MDEGMKRVRKRKARWVLLQLSEVRRPLSSFSLSSTSFLAPIFPSTRMKARGRRKERPGKRKEKARQ